MGAGGEAPPVKSEDVMILIGSSILLITIILQAWSVPTTVNEGEDNQYELKYDLSEGNEFSIEVLEKSGLYNDCHSALLLVNSTAVELHI